MNTSTAWQQAKLPVFIFAAFLFAVLWVLFGRLFFGVFGWMFFIVLFTIVPVMAIYGIVLTIIVAIRQRNFFYRRKGPFMVALYVTLAALFILGLCIPDGGDSRDSGGSALTVLMGDKSGERALRISGTLAGWSIFIALIASVATFVLAFFERTRRVTPQKAPDTLKQSR